MATGYANARPEVRTEEALTLPARFYTDPELFRRELSAVHYDMWLHAGRTEQLAGPGSYFLVRFAGANVIVVESVDAVGNVAYASVMVVAK